MTMKLNLRTFAYLLFLLQITNWAMNGFDLPEASIGGIILYEIGYCFPMILGIVLLIVEIIRIKKNEK